MSFRKNIRRTVSKINSDTISIDFDDQELWYSTGNYAINKMLSGKYNNGYLFGRSILMAGESGSGKSLLAAIALAEAQKQHNAYGIWCDIEKATTNEVGRQWLERLGVDTSPENFHYMEAATISDAKSLVAGIFSDMKKEQKEINNRNEQTPVVVVIDSLGMLMSDTQMEAAYGGEIKFDMGMNAKLTKDLVKQITHLSSRLPLSVISITHSMESMNIYEPDEKVLGGRGAVYAASYVIVANKMKLKADKLEKYADKRSINSRDPLKMKQVLGIKSKIQVPKSRFAKPNESVELQIPYKTGLNPYSGLFDQMKKHGIIANPSKGWFSYQEKGSEAITFREADFLEHADKLMNLIDDDKIVLVESEEIIVEDNGESEE